MNAELAVGDFAEFFREVHGHNPFPWQAKLMRSVSESRGPDGEVWPRVLDLPTGFGKTAALDIAVFHLALEADRGSKRTAPVRVAFVVDRRLVVDDAFERGRRLAYKLKNAQPGSVTARVAERLRALAGDGNPPLVVRRLRGGIPREDDWARTPSQPTILCSTVDQVGSRLLFRGYGVSDSMKPVHAGLLGADCLILLDEAHLSEPFRQTLRWVKGYRGSSWREDQHAAPWSVALLTATPAEESESSFQASPEDFSDDELRNRWNAPKTARIISLSKTGKAKKQQEDAHADNEQEVTDVGEKHRVEELIRLVTAALQEPGMPTCPVIAVVVNRVARARAIFQRLQDDFPGSTAAEEPASEPRVIPHLLIGPARSVDRDALADCLQPIRTGADRTLDHPVVIVATQCIEAGVDIDLDGLITEAAPLDALRQRFGRLNRKGRPITPYAAIVGDAKADNDDPVYGKAIAHTWGYLLEYPDSPADRETPATVNFGLAAFSDHLGKYLPAYLQEHTLAFRDLCAPRLDAPVLLPAHLDLLSLTFPIPNANPEVSLYLHGPNRAPDAVTILWRNDVDADFPNTADLLLLFPPRTGETIELPVWAVRRWLLQPRDRIAELADISGPIYESDKDQRTKTSGTKIFRWRSVADKSAWIAPNEIGPGDTIVVPTSYGGVDQWGWNPGSREPAADVADQAAKSFAGRRFAVRVAPQLFTSAGRSDLAAAIARASDARWQDLRDAVLEVVLADCRRLQDSNEPVSAARAVQLKEVATALERLNEAKGLRQEKEVGTIRMRRNRVELDTEIYGRDDDDAAQGVVFVAPFGLRLEKFGDKDLDSPNTTDDDLAGSFPGYPQSLLEHCEMVEKEVTSFAKMAGLPEDRIADLATAARLHDLGKADPRFQSWLAYGDLWGPNPDKPSEILAKSGHWLPRQARDNSGLPKDWRHEAFSVRLAEHTPRFQEAKDQDLVLWLIGTHHGRGRPLFPHCDPLDAEDRADLPQVMGIPDTLPAGPGPQSLAWNRDGLDWPGLYERLKARYGVWELARMEAILRLADHRASEKAAAAEEESA